MNSDEEAIRSLVATWMEASSRNELERVLELMAEDVVFIGAGRPPMRGRAAFAAASRAQTARGRIEGRVEVQEVRVFGQWAYCWNELTVTKYGAEGEAPLRLRGPALSILRKEPDGRWVIYRDANMVAPVPP
jgi:uncharacterized protein (TIGR02246 family)